MPANTRVTPTDFVQDYAAKRQAQLERAKRIREERLQQQQQQQQQQGGSSNNNNDDDVTHHGAYSTPEATPTAVQQPMTAGDQGRAHKERRILQVVEEDFTRATQAGIITPDQARQLWAMFSNQIIRVAASHPVVGLEAMLALSHATSSHSSQASSNNNNNGGDGFGGSISMESLRRSIAQFKKEQQKQQRMGPAYASRPSNRDEDTADASSQAKMAAYGEAQAELERGGLAQGNRKGRNNNNNAGGKPEWNFDTAVIPDTSAQSAAKEKKTRKGYGTNEKGSKVSYASERPYDEHHHHHESNDENDDGARNAARSLAGPALGRKNSAQGKASITRPEQTVIKPNQPAVTMVRRPPGVGVRPHNTPAPSNTTGVPTLNSFDDVPVGGHSGGSEMAWQEQPYATPDRTNNNVKTTSNTAKASNASGVDVNAEIAQAAAAAAAEPLRPCSCCGRTFRVSLLARHEALCRKQSKKPRRAFDMRGQRLDGLEPVDGAGPASSTRYGSHTTTSGGNNNNINDPGRGRGAARQNGSNGGAGADSAQAQKMAKWRLQHEQFQAAMRAVRSQAQAEKEYGSVGAMYGTGQHLPAPPPPLPAELDSRVPCPHCGRKFAEETAKRHIPHCANTIAKPKGIRPIRR